MDVRVIGGVVLLLASMIIGAKVIGASSHTSPVWAAAHDIAVGTVLDASDVVESEVNLGEHGPSYLATSSPLAGHVVTRDIRAGELVPAAALGTTGNSRVVAIAVAPDRMAPGVDHGGVIDLYLTTTEHNGTDTDVSTEQLLAGVTVQHVKAPSSGGLSGAMSSEYQVAVLLSPADADRLVKRLPTGEPLVVLHAGGDIPEAAPALGASADSDPSPAGPDDEEH